MLSLMSSSNPHSASEQVTVSATRTAIRLSETPGSTVLLSQEDVIASPALRVDDVLRQVPGFSLFRRSDSRTANASNQGVSLRGLGGTAASRALVLEDGFPLVDAFGGWVYWDRVPRESISSVEVFRGGASNLYGSDALGGVVQFLTRQPERPALSLETSYGNEQTPDLSVWTGTRVLPMGPLARLRVVPHQRFYSRSNFAARPRRYSRQLERRLAGVNHRTSHRR